MSTQLASRDRSRGMRKPVRLRAATRADLAALVRLEDVAFRGVYAGHRWNRHQFLHYVDCPRALVTVAVDPPGSLLGYIAGIVTRRRNGEVALVYSLAVHPTHRRGGTGRSLLRWFIGAVRRLGCRAVVLEVAGSRRGARRLFASEGFAPIESLPDYYARGADALRLALRLSTPVATRARRVGQRGKRCPRRES